MAWREIPQADLAEWNQRLLLEPAASIRQFPLFNEEPPRYWRPWGIDPGTLRRTYREGKALDDEPPLSGASVSWRQDELRLYREHRYSRTSLRLHTGRPGPDGQLTFLTGKAHQVRHERIRRVESAPLLHQADIEIALDEPDSVIIDDEIDAYDHANGRMAG